MKILTSNDKMLTSENAIELICFTITTIQACLELKYVKRSILLPTIKPLPNAPDYLIGLINIEDESVPVIDLAFRLGLLRNAPYHLDTPILLCKDEQKTIGLIVDKVIGLETVSEKKIQLQKDFNQNHSIFKASILSKNEIFFLIDINTLFATSVLSMEI